VFRHCSRKIYLPALPSPVAHNKSMAAMQTSLEEQAAPGCVLASDPILANSGYPLGAYMPQLASCHRLRSHELRSELVRRLCTATAPVSQRIFSQAVEDDLLDNLIRSVGPVDRARIRSGAARGAGHWLNVMPSHVLRLHTSLYAGDAIASLT
jgi:hypothetical protein